MIDFGGRKNCCESNDPKFASETADAVNFCGRRQTIYSYMRRREMSHRTLGRAAGHFKQPNGRTLTGRDYKRHGTTTLFASFKMGAGNVPMRPPPTATRRTGSIKPFHFMNGDFAAPTPAPPGKALHQRVDLIVVAPSWEREQFRGEVLEPFGFLREPN